MYSSFHSSFLHALIVTNYTSIHYAPINTDLKLLFYAIACYIGEESYKQKQSNYIVRQQYMTD